MRRLLLILSVFLILLPALAVRTPAAYDLGIIEASSAHTTSATGATAVPVMNCDRLSVTLTVTAGSGSVTSFQAFIRGSSDNTSYQALPAVKAMKDNNTSEGVSPAPYLVNEMSAVTVATVYTATYDLAVDYIKVAWIIAGTTPSETFSVRASCK